MTKHKWISSKDIVGGGGSERAGSDTCTRCGIIRDIRRGGYFTWTGKRYIGPHVPVCRYDRKVLAMLGYVTNPRGKIKIDPLWVIQMDDVFGFGKHIGRVVSDVVKYDPSYFQWLVWKYGFSVCDDILDMTNKG